MCLLVLAWRAHPGYRLIVAANRDEFHERPAAALGVWHQPALLAGRDLRAQGTWLAVGQDRRFGVITNFREGHAPRPGAPSRGKLIPDYLAGHAGPEEFLGQLAGRAAQFSGFNLLLSDRESLWYGSNRADLFGRPLEPGIHGLANELLDSPWPKLRRVRRGFTDWLASGGEDRERLFALLADRTPAPDSGEPVSGESDRDASDSGAPGNAGDAREWRRALSAPFVRHARYGTRCSSVVLLGEDDSISFTERRFDATGEACGESAFELAAGDWPGSALPY
ncbi:MAG: NRDE family protein [Proteobacteria bacterium]|nr:NRDE family protein [Pseudomonadota bacterium]